MQSYVKNIDFMTKEQEFRHPIKKSIRISNLMQTA